MTTAAHTLALASAAGVHILPGPDGSIRAAPRAAITPELRELLAEHKAELAALTEPKFNRHTQVCTAGEWFDFHHAPALPGEQIHVSYLHAGTLGTATIRNTPAAFVQLARQLQSIDQPERQEGTTP